MTRQFFILLTIIAQGLLFTGCGRHTDNNSASNGGTNPADTVSEKDMSPEPIFRNGYANVNGIKMYYEIYGSGKPIVLIHGGGSTIQSSFEKIIPLLSKHRQVIGVELQAHGRTSDRGKPSSFEQDADDVAALLNDLHIAKADFLGFSNGGNTTMQLAVRHPQIVDKIIVASAFYKRSGMYPQFWEGMKKASINDMPKQLKEAFLKVTPDSAKLQIVFQRDATRMQQFRDWSDIVLKSIEAQTLIVDADGDVVKPEHAVEMFRLIPHSQLLIVPGGHGEYMGEISFSNTQRKVESFVLQVEEFLSK